MSTTIYLSRADLASVLSGAPHTVTSIAHIWDGDPKHALDEASVEMAAEGASIVAIQIVDRVVDHDRSELADDFARAATDAGMAFVRGLNGHMRLVPVGTQAQELAPTPPSGVIPPVDTDGGQPHASGALERLRLAIRGVAAHAPADAVLALEMAILLCVHAGPLWARDRLSELGE